MILKDIAEPISGRQAEVLRELADHGQATIPRLIEQLYGGDPDGGPNDARNTIRQHVVYIRQKLKAGWRILSVDHNGLPTKTAGVWMYRLERYDIDDVFSDRRAREQEARMDEKNKERARLAEEAERRARAPLTVGNGRTYRG